jgi:hypothetical protein
MSFSSFISTKVQNPILIFQFQQDRDMEMAFCADTDKKTGNLTGLSMYYMRKSSGVLHRTKNKLTTSIFQPVLTKGVSKGRYMLHIRPVKTAFRIVQHKNHSFSCKYSFESCKKVGKVTFISIDAQRKPLKVKFTIHASFRKGKNDPVETLSQTLVAPDDFTKQLYQLFM